MTSFFSSSSMRSLIFLLVLLVQTEARVFSRVDISKVNEVTSLDPQRTFVLGFFNTSRGEDRWYLGIWHRRLPQEVVWIANRDKPVSKPVGTLEVRSTQLVLLDQSGKLVWWTKKTGANKKFQLIGELLETGNLVLRYANNNKDSFFWQSFQHPTDALISGMMLGYDDQSGLQSWRQKDDPSPGDYTFQVERRHELLEGVIRDKGSPRYRIYPWVSGIKNSYNVTVKRENITYVRNASVFSILRLTSYGKLEQSTHFVKAEKTSRTLDYKMPNDVCDVYNECGPNKLCDITRSPRCNCIEGFQPRDPHRAWELKDRLPGCVRKTPNLGDKFVMLQKIKVPDLGDSSVDMQMGLSGCKDKCIQNRTCTAYANADMQNGGSGCIIWDGGLIDVRVDDIDGGQDLYVRLERGGEDIEIIIVFIGVGLVLLLGFFSIVFFCSKTRNRPTISAVATRAIAPPIGVFQFAPMELEAVAVATNNFSESNKIGQGGFGTVYKGTLLDGQVIAAKRLLKRSAQSIDDFTNEVKLIATAQHVNLVQFLGVCSEREEMILVFEFLENSSLDKYLFDESQSHKLDWTKRLEIANEIARELLYLHQDSRFRIIHRDLKPANILLDKEMIPKISDFGMARLFGRDEIEGSTDERQGTYGYMSPEYVADGKFSIKSDVFSFGVLVLEIISGKRNIMFHYSTGESLVSFIWRNWMEGKGLEIVDPVIINSSTFRPVEVLRCIQIGLLCVQERVEDRPAMPSVILMFTSDRTEIDQPKPPGDLVLTKHFEVGSSSNWTAPLMTISLLKGR